ncbi:MAG: hypothetical protein F6K55_25535 [Moorea sp. SIO4A3]|nr:hypothetical protein [Moorena sp. SIO4A3]
MIFRFSIEVLEKSDAEVRPVANLIRLRKKHHYGLGGSPHERLHQESDRIS